jgi:NAD-dependent SIR2 family protein deacetylase
MRITKSQLINTPEKLRRHIVILGAGASVAAFPDGDATGKRLPTMDNFIKMLSLVPILERSGVKTIYRNFEEVYSELYEHDPESTLLKEIEETVYTFFDSLRLPERPTLYDHLLMSLRPKDVVATFNWDPFLFDAWNRNKDKVPVPEIVHLHGNVRVAHCPEHPTYGEHGMICPKCNRALIPSRLLYPVTMKNYSNDTFIKTEWEVFKSKLKQAMTLTIFGYSAPTTDSEAIDLMKSAWDKEHRFIERIEIIDIKNKESLWEQWDPFIVRTYLDHEQDYYESRISRYPRRSCEALIAQTVYGRFVEDNHIPRDADFDGLFSWFGPFIGAERALDSV